MVMVAWVQAIVVAISAEPVRAAWVVAVAVNVGVLARVVYDAWRLKKLR